MKLKAIINALAILGLIVGIFAHSYLKKTDKILPAFELVDTSGKMQASQQWANHILVINFWASWCAPCLEEIPELIEVQQKYHSKQVQFIGIAIDSLENIKPLLAKINYPVLIAGIDNFILAKQLGNQMEVIPFTVVVNQQGQLIYTKFGRILGSELEMVLASLAR